MGVFDGCVNELDGAAEGVVDFLDHAACEDCGKVSMLMANGEGGTIP